MNRIIAIGCALIFAIAACGTPSVDGLDAEPAATSEPAVEASEAPEATVATTGIDDAATSATTTTSNTPSTTQAQTSTTTRAPSDAAGGTESTTATSEGGDDGTTVEGGGDDAVIGQVPTHLMDQVFADAAARTGAGASTMTVLRAEAVTWPDGSLGCPEPGMQYTQALVPGYWVEIAVGEATLDYRLSERGGMKLCETGGLIPSPRDDT